MKIRFLFLSGILLAGTWLTAAEHIPPAPARFFNDYAGVVSRPVADRLNARLEQFERDSSNQLLVAIYPKMESDSSVQDYTVRVAQAWQVGRSDKNNGAILFSFMQEHKLYLQVGYGLEAVLPDAIAKRIIEREIVPRFRAGDIDGGMTAAVEAMIAAAKGEYQGTGRTEAESHRPVTARSAVIIVGAILFISLLFVLFVREGLRRQPSIFVNPRRRNVITTNTWWTGGGGGSGSSWGGGGGGGFSGGGGSFGGGGAGGSW